MGSGLISRSDYGTNRHLDGHSPRCSVRHLVQDQCFVPRQRLHVHQMGGSVLVLGLMRDCSISVPTLQRQRQAWPYHPSMALSSFLDFSGLCILNKLRALPRSPDLLSHRVRRDQPGTRVLARLPGSTHRVPSTAGLQLVRSARRYTRLNSVTCREPSHITDGRTEDRRGFHFRRPELRTWRDHFLRTRCLRSDGTFNVYASRSKGDWRIPKIVTPDLDVVNL